MSSEIKIKQLINFRLDICYQVIIIYLLREFKNLKTNIDTKIGIKNLKSWLNGMKSKFGVTL